MDINNVLAFMKDNSPFFYTTINGDTPRVRPFGFAMIFEGKLYVGMGKHKQSFDETVKNPNIEICSYMAAERKWMRLRGTAVLDDRQEVMDEVFRVSPGLKNLYNEQTGNVLGNFYLKDATAEFASMSGYFEKVEL